MSHARVVRAIRSEDEERERKDSSLLPLPLAHVFSRGQLAVDMHELYTSQRNFYFLSVHRELLVQMCPRFKEQAQK